MHPLRCTMLVAISVATSFGMAVNISELCDPVKIQEGLAMFAHPSECTMYLECDVARILHARSCSDGLFYDPTLFTCVFPYDIDCPKDRCQQPGLKAYSLPNDTCTHYYVCKDGWTYERQCCGSGLAFDGSNGCKIDPSCNSTCDTNTTTVAVDPDDCFNIPDPTNSSRFFMLDNGKRVPMSCALGSLYDVATCHCSILDLRFLLRNGNIECKPTLRLDFSGGKIRSFEDKSGLWTYVENRHVSLSDELTLSGDNRAARFNGIPGQSIVVPRFTQTDFMNDLRISLAFKLLPNDAIGPYEHEAIVTNSDSDACNNVSPSFSLTVNRREKTVRAALHTTLPQEIVTVNRNLSPNDWNDVTVTYDGESVTLILNHIPVKSEPTGHPAKIEPVQCPLHIGSGRAMEYFNGLIDTVEVQLC